MSVIVPTPAQRLLIDRHLDELEVWNRRLNLTTVPRADAWNRHVVESLRLLEVAALTARSRCADIGSGAGFPGMPIAVVRPDVSMTLVESDRHKAGFLTHVAGLLELDNVSVDIRRAEEMAADPTQRGAYDALFSRAAAPPPLLVALSLPLLREGGRLWALVADSTAAVAAVAAATGGAVAAAPGIFMVERLPGAAADPRVRGSP